MSTPKQHHSKGRVTRKRYRYRQEEKQLVKCTNCEAEIMPHRVCSTCGQYKGREVVKVK